MELSSPAPGPLVDEEPPGSSESRREGHQEVTLGIAEGDGLPRCTKQRAEARSNSHPTPAPALAPDGEKTQSLRASKRRVEELSTRLKHLTYQREAVSEARRTYEEACMLQRRQLLAIHSEREKALLLLQRLLEESAGVNDKLIAYEVICSTKTLDDPLLAARLPKHETDPTSGTGSSNGSGENSCPSKSGDSERIEVVAVKVMEVALTPRTKKRKLAKLAATKIQTLLEGLQHQARLHRLLNRTAELLQRWQQLRLLNCRDEENMLQSLPQHISTITRLRLRALAYGYDCRNNAQSPRSSREAAAAERQLQRSCRRLLLRLPFPYSARLDVPAAPLATVTVAGAKPFSGLPTVGAEFLGALNKALADSECRAIACCGKAAAGSRSVAAGGSFHLAAAEAALAAAEAAADTSAAELRAAAVQEHRAAAPETGAGAEEGESPRRCLSASVRRNKPRLQWEGTGGEDITDAMRHFTLHDSKKTLHILTPSQVTGESQRPPKPPSEPKPLPPPKPPELKWTPFRFSPWGYLSRGLKHPIFQHQQLQENELLLEAVSIAAGENCTLDEAAVIQRLTCELSESSPATSRWLGFRKKTALFSASPAERPAAAVREAARILKPVPKSASRTAKAPTPPPSVSAGGAFGSRGPSGSLTPRHHGAPPREVEGSAAARSPAVDLATATTPPAASCAADSSPGNELITTLHEQQHGGSQAKHDQQHATDIFNQRPKEQQTATHGQQTEAPKKIPHDLQLHLQQEQPELYEHLWTPLQQQGQQPTRHQSAWKREVPVLLRRGLPSGSSTSSDGSSEEKAAEENSPQESVATAAAGHSASDAASSPGASCEGWLPSGSKAKGALGENDVGIDEERGSCEYVHLAASLNASSLGPANEALFCSHALQQVEERYLRLFGTGTPGAIGIAAANSAAAAATPAAVSGGAAAFLPAVTPAATPVTAVEIAMQNHLANLQAVQAAAAQAKQLAARKKSELGLGVAVTAVDGRLPPAQSLVSGVLVAEPEADQLERTCFVQGFPEEYDEKEVSLLLNDLAKVVAIRLSTNTSKPKYAIVEFENAQEAAGVLALDGKNIGSSVLTVKKSGSLVEFRDPDGVLFEVPAPPILSQIKQQQQLLQSPEQQKEQVELRDKRIAAAKDAIERRLRHAQDEREVGKVSARAVAQQPSDKRRQSRSGSRFRSRDRRPSERKQHVSRSPSAPSRSLSPAGGPSRDPFRGPLRDRSRSVPRRDSVGSQEKAERRPLLRPLGSQGAAAVLKEKLKHAAYAEGEERDMVARMHSNSPEETLFVSGAQKVPSTAAEEETFTLSKETLNLPKETLNLPKETLSLSKETTLYHTKERFFVPQKAFALAKRKLAFIKETLSHSKRSPFPLSKEALSDSKATASNAAQTLCFSGSKTVAAVPKEQTATLLAKGNLLQHYQGIAGEDLAPRLLRGRQMLDALPTLIGGDSSALPGGKAKGRPRPRDALFLRGEARDLLAPPEDPTSLQRRPLHPKTVPADPPPLPSGAATTHPRTHRAGGDPDRLVEAVHSRASLPSGESLRLHLRVGGPEGPLLTAGALRLAGAPCSSASIQVAGSVLRLLGGGGAPKWPGGLPPREAEALLSI
ncbi:RNA recognition family related protein [Cyclospora cayetanensis]|uniref:RNA recognition family related protein n=1 Tax=Cyclospora cayetanensis TaxID=88456 RepID=A0A1D3D3N9_9EIME|nr:RNA recognition family related protein [Cyclospora cayetanensis]